jgi:hypothetical protein
MSEPRVALLRWVVACTLAEALGITVVSVTYAALDRNLIAPAAPWILLAGGWEGLCLGSAQALFLRRLRVNPALWIGLTVAGAIVGYGLSLLGGAGAEDTGSAYDPPLWMMAVLGAGAGLGMGVAMGVIQMPALRGRLSVKGWIAANAIGWMPAMAVIMAAAGLAERSWSLMQVAFAGGLSGAVAGLCIGAATGVILTRAS